MQQRRVRLGDILDDYCPRERRITNHAVVAMIEDDVKQTRCTTCDADHEYKDGKVPMARRRKSEGVLSAVDAESRPELVAADAHVTDDDEPLEPGIGVASDDANDPPAPALFAASEAAPADELAVAGDEGDDEQPVSEQDEWPVHRPLIRATLPRPEGHVPERKEPEFTMRQSRFEGNRNGQRHGRGPRRQAQGQPGQFGQVGHRPSGQGQGQGGERNGNRAPQPGHRGGGRPGGGQGGQRHGGGRGPKRGR
ncbi:MAG TPA: hypothetical protein VM819_08295 [Vicinamibacterales bacterium]|nr:hypothetical protein [Vicinamibacterales bacterium]